MNVFQSIYSDAVDPVHRRGNSQPDLLSVRTQKDTSGGQTQSNRSLGKSNIDTMASKCRSFNKCLVWKYESFVLCPSLVLFCLTPSCFLFQHHFSPFLALSTPTYPLSLPLLFSSSFSFHLQNLSPVQDGSRQTQQTNRPRFDSS